MVVEDLRKKEKKMLGLDRQVSRSGFIVFEDRIAKLKMMQTPLFLFGMKLYRQNGHLEFFDADFCNTVLVKSEALVDLTLRDVCNIINEMLQKSGFEGELLKIGTLKDLEDFDLGKISVRRDYQISLRFNTFYDALNAFQCLSLVDDATRQFNFRCYFMNPSPNYYDGRMATQFETCIKDKFEGLHHINEVPSSYIK